MAMTILVSQAEGKNAKVAGFIAIPWMRQKNIQPCVSVVLVWLKNYKIVDSEITRRLRVILHFKGEWF